MLSFQENNSDISIILNNKLSITQVSDIFNICYDSKSWTLTQFEPVFHSEAISDLSDDLFIGTFSLNNGMKITGSNSLELQKIYLEWEAEQLNRNFITFLLPENKNDLYCGIAPFNPYFFAVINKLARSSHGLDLIGLGTFLSKRELKFIHQYCSFHPALRNFLSLKNPDSKRVILSCKIVELLVDNAISHVVGYRDKMRFKNLYTSNNIDISTDEVNFFSTKFLMEYDHILDSSSIWKEEFDFFNSVSHGGQLDILNLPF